jgi:hypothetical protein
VNGLGSGAHSSQVLAALNHAAYTFRSFTAADWRDMAEECQRQVDERTCVDCGNDVMTSPYAESSSKKSSEVKREHRLRGNRWSCR